MSNSAVYSLLARLPPAPPTLTAELRTIVLAAGDIAAGDAEGAAAAFSHLRGASVNKAYDLCILQAPAFIGFPRTLHSAWKLYEAGVRTSYTQAGGDPEMVFNKVYGNHGDRVRERLRSMHPILEQDVLKWGYRSLSRRGPSLREREFCAIAMLAGEKCAETMLYSHLRGACRAGATADEIQAILQHTILVHGTDAAERCNAVWQRVVENRTKRLCAGDSP